MPEIRPLAIGAGMSLAAWWDARAELCEAFVAAGGEVVSPELAARARELLEGRAVPRRFVSGLTGSAARRWWQGRRLAVELLEAALSSPDGAVVDIELVGHIRGLLACTVKLPRLANARTLAKTRPARIVWAPPARAASGDETVPF